MEIRIKTATYSFRGVHPLGEYAYTFDCTFFRLTCLTAKALGRITMRAFPVGAIEPKKRTLKSVQLRIPGSKLACQFFILIYYSRNINFSFRKRGDPSIFIYRIWPGIVSC